jgi:hypothetical protein
MIFMIRYQLNHTIDVAIFSTWIKKEEQSNVMRKYS